ncbi:gastrula zinc finger protein XlCGF17.1-like [Ixodes scapularis]|uniref:gastrula zinc finger protein XlCGF17.1-like n=1 Tax=Ixodes scapularis TaxID=6945 RepID=UPI001A9E4247|nr:gastrula zinc finger protein XlCGF17.1-like [Ixodes scapularis]
MFLVSRCINFTFSVAAIAPSFFPPLPSPTANDQRGRDIDNSFSEKPKGTHIFGCDLCSYSCYSENRVMRHRVNHATPPLQCHVCGDEFPLFVSLVRHMRTHFTAKPYRCDVCLARFTVSNLRDHMRTHTGERPFACGHCQKSFAQKSSLTKHLAVHTGAGVFTCNLCAQAFANKSALKEHVASHFGAQEVLSAPVPPALPNDAERGRASPRDVPPAEPGVGPPSASGKSPLRLLRSESPVRECSRPK